MKRTGRYDIFSMELTVAFLVKQLEKISLKRVPPTGYHGGNTRQDTFQKQSPETCVLSGNFRPLQPTKNSDFRNSLVTIQIWVQIPAANHTKLAFCTPEARSTGFVIPRIRAAQGTSDGRNFGEHERVTEQVRRDYTKCCIIPEIKKYFKNPLTNNDN